MKMHYAGALIIRKNGSSISISPGYAACCSGERAVAIRRQGNHTYNPSDVNCTRCQKMLGAVGKSGDSQ